MDLKRPSQSGFSLLETLLGILIMTLSVIGSFEVLRLGDLRLATLASTGASRNCFEKVVILSFTWPTIYYLRMAVF